MKPYLVTLDIHGLIDWEKTNLQETALLDIRRDALKNLQSVTPSPPHTLEYRSVKKKMEGSVDYLLESHPLATVISLDDLLYRPHQARAVLSLSRFCGIGDGLGVGSKILGQTSRPGSRPVEEQLTALDAYPELVITDVGCFEGSQMEFTVKVLQQRGHRIGGIVTGIFTQEASQRLKDRCGLPSPDAPVVGCNYYPEITDWIEERDFYPCLGGVAVADSDGQVLEAPNGIGLPCRRPYLLPFADIRERASLMGTDAELINFSYRQIKRTIEVFRVLANARNMGTGVAFKDIKWLLKKPSFPYSGIKELDEMVEPRMPVVEYLERVLKYMK